MSLVCQHSFRDLSILVIGTALSLAFLFPVAEKIASESGGDALDVKLIPILIGLLPPILICLYIFFMPESNPPPLPTQKPPIRSLLPPHMPIISPPVHDAKGYKIRKKD